MKFLIQKVNREVVHDFSFALIQSIKFQNWMHQNDDIKYKFMNTGYLDGETYFNEFKPFHAKYIPIGTNEFVSLFLKQFYGKIPKPTNIPSELLPYEFTKRFVFNGTEKEIEGEKFIKSNDVIKGYTQIVNDHTDVPEGKYQISEVISIDSEWRAFVYKDKLVGLKHYCGEFTMYPLISPINAMIKAYKNAPIAYTLDIGINDQQGTFVIECHDFF